MLVALGLAAVAQPPEATGQRGIARDNGPAVAERAEVLGRIEAEGAGDAECADRAAGGGCQVRLRAVLDDGQPVPRATASMAVMSAAWPYRCTGMIARCAA